MKHLLVGGAAAVILAANGVALFHAAANRTGQADSGIVLSDDELKRDFSLGDENTGVSLRLTWIDTASGLYPGETSWLDQSKLRELGVDTSVPPSDPRAAEFYQRQLPHRAFVALEYDGPALKSWMDSMSRRFPQRQSVPYRGSHLVSIDAARDPGVLRSRHPDRNTVIILPAVVRVGVQIGLRGSPSRLYGSVQEVPSSIHVPRPYSDRFRGRPQDLQTHYSVHLRFGSDDEPWIEGVDFDSPDIHR